MTKKKPTFDPRSVIAQAVGSPALMVPGKSMPKEKKSPQLLPKEKHSYRKTGKGYVRADGTEVVRLTIFCTGEEREKIKSMAVGDGFYGNVSAYILHRLGLLE